MNQRGLPIDSDGVYGPQFKKVCIAFQRNQGLVVDGIIGKATWEASFAT